MYAWLALRVLSPTRVRRRCWGTGVLEANVAVFLFNSRQQTIQARVMAELRSRLHSEDAEAACRRRCEESSTCQNSSTTQVRGERVCVSSD